MGRGDLPLWLFALIVARDAGRISSRCRLWKRTSKCKRQCRFEGVKLVNTVTNSNPFHRFHQGIQISASPQNLILSSRVNC